MNRQLELLLIISTLILLSASSSAQRCYARGPPRHPFADQISDCYEVGVCFPENYLMTIWRCSECSPDVYCADYDIDWVCNDDPCKAGGATPCQWKDGYCYNECVAYGADDAICRNNNCWMEYDESCDGSACGACGPKQCVECKKEIECRNYLCKEDCEANPCKASSGKVAGGCVWGVGMLGEACLTDLDGDKVADNEDNCVTIGNSNQENQYCDKPGGDWNTNRDACDENGDHCDDTDGDGLFDATEDNNTNGSFDWGIDMSNPMDIDTNDNCIGDGVEFGFNPIFDLLKKIAVGAAVTMLAYHAAKWIMSENPADRDNAKKSIIYTLFGTILLVGGNQMAVFILSANCQGETPDRGYTCNCTPPSGTGGTEGSCPFVYSYDGERYYYEHESFPYAALKALEYETYGALTNLKSVNGSYILKVTEERDEESYINRLKLDVIDYDGYGIMPDVRGRVHTVGESISPQSCETKGGDDCLEDVKGEDNLYWTSNLEGKDLTAKENYKDYVILNFGKRRADNVKLLVSMKSTILLDKWGIALQSIGNYNELSEKILSAPIIGEKWKDKVFEESMMHVQLWDGAKWAEQERIGVGREGWVQLLIPINLSGLDTDEITVRLIAPAGTYEVNSVHIDTTPDRKYMMEEAVPYDATSSGGEDMLAEIVSDDGEYANLKKGEHAIIRYRSVPEEQGYSRGYVVSAKGYFYLTRVNNISAVDTIRNIPEYLRMAFEEDYGPKYLTPRVV
ncbi:MAG: pilin [Candidatus Altiarchaeota archaeon]